MALEPTRTITQIKVDIESAGNVSRLDVIELLLLYKDEENRPQAISDFLDTLPTAIKDKARVGDKTLKEKILDDLGSYNV